MTQYGPGAEAAFAAVAQAYGDRSPILLIPGEHDRAAQDSAPNLRTEQAYRPITRFAATVNDAGRAPEVFRRALHALRGVRDGPVLVAVANDVLYARRRRRRLGRRPRRRRGARRPRPRTSPRRVRMLAAASGR